MSLLDDMTIVRVANFTHLMFPFSLKVIDSHVASKKNYIGNECLFLTPIIPAFSFNSSSFIDGDVVNRYLLTSYKYSSIRPR